MKKTLSKKTEHDENIKAAASSNMQLSTPGLISPHVHGPTRPQNERKEPLTFKSEGPKQSQNELKEPLSFVDSGIDDMSESLDDSMTMVNLVSSLTDSTSFVKGETQKLIELDNKGFKNRTFNKVLLKMHHGNLERVIKDLKHFNRVDCE